MEGQASIRLENKLRTALQFTKTAAVLLSAYAAFRLCACGYAAASNYLDRRYQAFVTERVEKEVHNFEFVLSSKKGTVANLDELDKSTLGKELFIALNQYRSCVKDMQEIGSRAGLFSPQFVEVQ